MLKRIFSLFKDKTPEHIKKGRQLIEELRREKNFDADLVRRLIAEGASLELTDVLGRTALHIAIVEHKGVVPDILRRNPPLDVKDSFGRTPLFSAVMEGDVEIVKTLAARNPASVRIPNASNDAPLNRAAETGDLRLVRILLEAGAEIDRKGRWGNTPLMSAAENSCQEVISYLLDEGADPTIVNEKGRNAVEILSLSRRQYWHHACDAAEEKLQSATAEKQERAAEEQRQEIAEELKNGSALKEPVKKRPSIRFD